MRIGASRWRRALAAGGPGTRGGARALRWVGLTGLLLALAPGPAAGHAGSPRVWSIRFHAATGAQPWVVDEMGLLLGGEGGFRWLCDDAVSLTAGLRSAEPLDAAGAWLVATREGVSRTEDGGCRFEAVAGPLQTHFIGSVSVDPGGEGVALVGTATLGRPNGVYRSEDRGRSWRLTSPEGDGRVRGILRAPANSDRVYVADGAGLLVSDDGGAGFERRTLGPAALDPQPDEVRLLAVDPRRPDRLFVALERFPDGAVVVTEDAGRTWRAVLTVRDDSAESMVVDPAGDRWLVSTPFSGLWRSEDGGERWARLETPGALGCLEAEPGSDRIWACLRGAPLPWVLATSTDGGESWTPRLAAYAGIAGGLACPPESPTAQTCGRQCNPEDRSGCAGPDAGRDAAPADAGGGDGGVADGAVDGPREDAGAGGSSATAESSTGGCVAAPAPAEPPWSWVLGGLGLLRARRRPRRRRPLGSR